jgi:ribosomal protein L7/L12
MLPDETLRAVHDLVRDDQLIDAVKLVRKHSGAGLRDAKLFVEAQSAARSQLGDDVR